VAVNPKYIFVVASNHTHNHHKGDEDIRQKSPTRAVIYTLADKQSAWHDAKHQGVEQHCPREEARRLRHLGIEDIAHHTHINQHIVGVDEIEAYGIAYESQSDDIFAHNSARIEEQIVDKVVERKHKYRHATDDPRTAKIVAYILDNIAKKRIVESQQSV
jgi:hypothetical protein